jgi:3-hydroxybutyryl-CoA dehydrogenase
VVLRSRKQETADAMLASLEKSLTKQVERGKLSEDDKAATLGRVTATAHIGALADCDLSSSPWSRTWPSRRSCSPSSTAW